MARTAEVKRDARIGEAEAKRDAQIKEAIAEEERMAARSLFKLYFYLFMSLWYGQPPFHLRSSLLQFFFICNFQDYNTTKVFI